jgi:hypothetical protein
MIHSYKNEMYCFNGRDHEFYLDITDDWTGDLHAVARRHIPPFVNEIQDPSREIPAVHARLDPEGALHYLLGHPELEQGDFCFTAKGNEEEIFVDYGPEYEMVVSTRCRGELDREYDEKCFACKFLMLIPSFHSVCEKTIHEYPWMRLKPIVGYLWKPATMLRS